MMSHVCSSVLHGKNLSVRNYMQNIQPDWSIPAMLIGTIDFYLFIPFSLSLTLSGITRSAQSKTYWLHFLAHFHLIRMW